MKKIILIISGVVLLGSAVVWRVQLAQRWTQRIAPGWKWKSSFVGVMSYADPETGKLPDKAATSIYERQAYIVSDAERPSSVVMEDCVIISDPKTKQKTWEYILRAKVDPKTGAHQQEEYVGDIYLFPRNVEKTTYNFRSSYVKGVPLSFEKEEEIEGVKTYLFCYIGRAEYTESYAGNLDFPGVKVEPGQEITCADDQFIFRAWVEPVTGEILKMDEGCPSGDYVNEISTGKRLAAVCLWAGTTAGDDVVDRAEIIRAERARYLWAALYLPCLLLVSGLLCLGFGAFPLVRPVPKSTATEGHIRPEEMSALTE